VAETRLGAVFGTASSIEGRATTSTSRGGPEGGVSRKVSDGPYGLLIKEGSVSTVDSPPFWDGVGVRWNGFKKKKNNKGKKKRKGEKRKSIYLKKVGGALRNLYVGWPPSNASETPNGVASVE